MPFKSPSDAIKDHPNLKKYSKKAQDAWVKAFNNAFKQYKDEGKSYATAYSVANKIDGVKSISQLKKAQGEDEKPVICVDFDDTIAENKYPEIGKPKKNVKESLKYLQETGYHIKIFSCRTNGEKNEDAQKQENDIKEYLDVNNIPYDSIAIEDKPFADFYIDDKAITFDGDWNDVLSKIEIKRIDENNIIDKIVKSYQLSNYKLIRFVN